MINKLQKPILEELLKDYCKSKGCHVYLGSNNYPDNSTKFFINDTFYYVDWKECDNVYDAFMKIVEDLDKSKRTPEFYLTMPRNSGKTFYANQIWEYMRNDVESAHALARSRVRNIKDVIFNPPATIILWMDGTKTVVKAQDGEEYDPEKGFAMAVTKKHFGNEGNYFTEVKKWVDKYEEKVRMQQAEEFCDLLCKITLPDLTPAISAMDTLKEALRITTPLIDPCNNFNDDVKENVDEADRETKRTSLEKIDRVLTAFDTCTTSYGCIRCPYDTNKGKNCTSDRRVENIEILNEYRDLLEKELGE